MNSGNALAIKKHKKGGTGHFWYQRLTAVLLLPLVIWLVISVAALSGADYATARDFFASPWQALLLLLFLLMGLMHLALGIQMIIEDYVQNKFLEMLSHFLNLALCCALAAASVFAVLTLNLGA
jgi:succinate dehydrogenase / fumarate reductase membrane anchor subunit